MSRYSSSSDASPPISPSSWKMRSRTRVVRRVVVQVVVGLEEGGQVGAAQQVDRHVAQERQPPALGHGRPDQRDDLAVGGVRQLAQKREAGVGTGVGVRLRVGLRVRVGLDLGRRLGRVVLGRRDGFRLLLRRLLLRRLRLRGLRVGFLVGRRGVLRDRLLLGLCLRRDGFLRRGRGGVGRLRVRRRGIRGCGVRLRRLLRDRRRRRIGAGGIVAAGGDQQRRERQQ